MTKSHTSPGDNSADAESTSLSPAPGKRESRLRLLVVDDLADAADSLAILLRMLGHTVRIAYDGAKALTEAVEFRPHAALLDLGLPKLTGFQVASCLRQQPGMQSLCLIAISGYGTETDQEQARQAGFDHHLIKPINLERLISILSERALQVE